MHNNIHTVNAILATLPYIQKFKNKIIVIKYGGAAQTDSELKSLFAQDITLLQLVGIRPVIVHGGGKKINTFLEKLSLKGDFKDGLRITNSDTMEVVEMILSGSINKEITNLLNHHGARAIGLSGKDANFLQAKAIDYEKYGLVGKITKVKHKILKKILKDGFIPVIAPIGSGKNVKDLGYNINADLAASKIAKSLKAEKILFLTDTEGILDKNGQLISKLYENEVEDLKKDGTISGGMLPKTEACLEAVNGGVKNAHIIDGRIKHSILLELFTNEGIGTIIKNKKD